MATEYEVEMRCLFLDEASQNLVDAEQCFLALESAPNDPSLIDNLFRLAHNLKGSANAVGFSELGQLTHELESYLLKLKAGDILIDAASVNLLLRCNDQIVAMVTALKDDHASQFDVTSLREEIRAHIDGTIGAAAAPSTESEQHHDAVAEISAMPEPSTTPTPELTLAPPEAAPKKAAGSAQTPDETIRVSLQRVEKLLNFIGEMVILQTVLKEQVNSSGSLLLRKTVRQLGKVSKEVQEISMSLRMVPLKPTMQKMQRIVRDTSAELGKKVTLDLRGEETELDKTILEKLGDPLVHLIRNAVDHGIEGPELRRERGKPENAAICLSAYHRGGRLIIEVKDDGAGMDAQRLKAKAVEKGLIKSSASISDKEAYQLIFHSGFSTKAAVSSISGRGVGMDVVKTNIEQLQGEIEIETELGKGTCFRILLPLTLAIMDGMTVVVDSQRYVIPLSHVHESTRPRREDIHFVSGMGNVFCLRGDKMPLYYLSQLLGNKPKQGKPSPETTAIVVRATGQAFAVVVDGIIEQYQVVIKQLGQEHENLKGISGSAILGDGRVALILELPELVSRFKMPSSSGTPKRNAA